METKKATALRARAYAIAYGMPNSAAAHAAALWGDCSTDAVECCAWRGGPAVSAGHLAKWAADPAVQAEAALIVGRAELRALANVCREITADLCLRREMRHKTSAELWRIVGGALGVWSHHRSAAREELARRGNKVAVGQ